MFLKICLLSALLFELSFAVWTPLSARHEKMPITFEADYNDGEVGYGGGGEQPNDEESVVLAYMKLTVHDLNLLQQIRSCSTRLCQELQGRLTTRLAKWLQEMHRQKQFSLCVKRKGGNVDGCGAPISPPDVQDDKTISLLEELANVNSGKMDIKNNV